MLSTDPNDSVPVRDCIRLRSVGNNNIVGKLNLRKGGVPACANLSCSQKGLTTTSSTMTIIKTVGISLTMRKNFWVCVFRSRAKSAT